MAWRNPFKRRSRTEPAKKISEADVKTQGRKAFAQYRKLMEHFRSWQDAAYSKSKMVKTFKQWKAKRSMLATNRVLQKERARAEKLNQTYRRQGGGEIRLSKREHEQLTGGIPPTLIRDLATLPRLSQSPEPRRVELRRLTGVRKKPASRAPRHAVEPQTRKRVRERLESLYKEFKTDPNADKVAVQRTFKTIAAYARTLKSEEAHVRFDSTLKEVVKQLNQNNPMRASQILTQLHDAIHHNMRVKEARPSEKPNPIERPTHTPAQEKKETTTAEKGSKPPSETTAKEPVKTHLKEKARKPTAWERMKKSGRSMSARWTNFSARPRKPGKLAKNYDTPSAAITGIFKALRGRPGAPPVETVARLKAASESPNPEVKSAAETALNEALQHMRNGNASAAGLAIIGGASQVSALQRSKKKSE